MNFIEAIPHLLKGKKFEFLGSDVLQFKDDKFSFYPKNKPNDFEDINLVAWMKNSYALTEYVETHDFNWAWQQMEDGENVAIKDKVGFYYMSLSGTVMFEHFGNRICCLVSEDLINNKNFVEYREN